MELQHYARKHNVQEHKVSGLLPAPLIIFSTFLGFLGGGWAGALLITVGIFLPAFAITRLGHDTLDRLVHQPRIRVFLAGVTAGVVGLIAGTTVLLLRTSVTSLQTTPAPGVLPHPARIPP